MCNDLDDMAWSELMRVEELPQELFQQMEGWSSVPPGFECDGCSWSPDEFGAIDIRPACLVHDSDYAKLREWVNFGSCPVDREDWEDHEDYRKACDQRFYRNLRRCGLSRFMSGVYYRRVRMHGVDAVYSDRHLPSRSRLRAKFVLFFKRYIPTW